MNTEQDMYKQLKNKVPGMWVRIEPYSGQVGVPDCLLSFYSDKTYRCESVFIELKVKKGLKNPLRPTQKATISELLKHRARVIVLYWCPRNKVWFAHNSKIIHQYYLQGQKDLPKELFQTPIKTEHLERSIKVLHF